MLYLYLMINKNELTEQLIKDLFEHLKQLDAEDKLVLCGPFHDYPGSMVVFNADNYGQAILIAESDPFIHSGCKTYELRSLEVANKDNHYLL
ncbi:YciI family protein [Streptococcus parasuis]|uniref:YciI family protein n=1 Tax=Streptococcus parasuis TaxID=1501662 RepID=UPI0025A4F4E5|nr:YciI family protein [Streptococcus parasuis]WJQ85972.1 YciI family protein [Streptococcus parasuis]